MYSKKHTDINSSHYWDERYNNNEAGWDLKSPNPVFIKYLQDTNFFNKGRLLAIGCGKCYDGIAAAELGFDVTALDFSSIALEYAKKYSEENNLKINFSNDDIFTIGDKYENTFDIVYEYTTFCAIDPSRREEMIKVIAKILKPGGKLLTIIFPIDGRPGGPPFAIDYFELFNMFKPQFKLLFSSKNINSIKPRKGKEILQIYRKI